MVLPSFYDKSRVLGETRGILLPHHTDQVSHIALDASYTIKLIGGSLIKVVYFSRRPGIAGGRLNFARFETTDIDTCIEFLQTLIAESKSSNKTSRPLQITATGGGAHKYHQLILDRLNIDACKEDEMECLITGINFFIEHISNEVFMFSEQGEMGFEEMTKDRFPFLLVNIGSGVSLIKVTGPNQHERISGTSLGGGTFWGLMSLLEGNTSFDAFLDILEMTKEGNNANVDLLVGDIYGTDYNKVGLKATTIASSMGKAFRHSHSKSFNNADVARSLLFMISNNIGQIAYLNARAHNLTRIYFGGYFIRGHAVTMGTLSYAIKFWSAGSMQAFFLRHEGYLGAVGAFLKHQNTLKRSSFSENFTRTTKIAINSVNAMGWHGPLPKLLDVREYRPDTHALSLPEDHQYWLNALERNLSNLSQLAIDWQPEDKEGAHMRVEAFVATLREHFARLSSNPGVYGALTVRSLLDLRERCLHEFGFFDVFEPVKRREVDASINTLPGILKQVDAITDIREKWTLLINNVLAGNMFDWGSNQTLELLRNHELVFETAGELIEYPPEYYDASSFIDRIETGPVYQHVVAFVDNSGADIVLGILPFVRQLIAMGTRVTLAANSYPALNDITTTELLELMDRVIKLDRSLADAWRDGNLTIIGTGSDSPCLDLRRLNEDCAAICTTADLIIIEGMGRAIHTNLNARFNCDALKIAVFKNAWAAKKSDTVMYCGMCRFEPAL
ncbi:fumble-domain-containing protein [Syncephalis fuscata]|nr:fumble-domain-containing protein [Syncephalis fuscata]